MSSYPNNQLPPDFNQSVRAKSSKKRSPKTSCTESKRVLSLDMFGTGIALNYPNGEQTYQTASGSCVSVLVSVLTLVFCIQNFLILYGYNGSTFTSARLEGHFDTNHTHT